MCLIAELGQAPHVSWDRERDSDVVQELLKHSSDKAYGRKGTGFDTGLRLPTIGLFLPDGEPGVLRAWGTGLSQLQRWGRNVNVCRPLHKGQEPVPVVGFVSGGIWRDVPLGSGRKRNMQPGARQSMRSSGSGRGLTEALCGPLPWVPVGVIVTI